MPAATLDNFTGEGYFLLAVAVFVLVERVGVIEVLFYLRHDLRFILLAVEMRLRLKG